MAFEFKNILSAMGLKNSTDPVTAANLQAADDKIALLEKEKADAETRANSVQGALDTANAALTTAKADLATAQGDLTKVKGELTTATDKVATLEKWKQGNKAADERTEDESNKLGDEGAEPKAGFELEAAAQIARVKKRVGEKA
jgi:chromosome segregation ATPase